MTALPQPQLCRRLSPLRCCALCVAREMATTFARLCQQVDQTQKELDAEICLLTAKTHQLETVQSRSKSLRSVRIVVYLVNAQKTLYLKRKG